MTESLIMTKAKKATSKGKGAKNNSPDLPEIIHWPSQKELFDAALRLAGDKKFYRNDANTYVRRALWLWLEADKAAQLENTDAYLEPKIEHYTPVEDGRTKFLIDGQNFQDDQSLVFRGVRTPLPEDYPLSFSKFLSCLWQNKKTDERLKLYRTYLRYNFRITEYCNKGLTGPITQISLPSISDVADTLKRDKEDIRIPNESVFWSRSRWIMKWFHHYSKENKVERAKKGAKARQAKSKVS